MESFALVAEAEANRQTEPLRSLASGAAGSGRAAEEFSEEELESGAPVSPTAGRMLAQDLLLYRRTHTHTHHMDHMRTGTRVSF